jgi:hypothetical protein
MINFEYAQGRERQAFEERARIKLPVGINSTNY